jgi:subtilisin family serine protease
LLAVLAATLTLPATALAVPSSQVLVKFVHGTSAQTKATVLKRAGLTEVRQVPDLGYVVAASADSTGTTAALAALADAAAVVTASRDGVGHIAAAPNDPYFQTSYSWNFSRTQLTDAWALSTGSPQTKIAVIDTGVDPSTTDLQGALLPGYDFVNNDTDPNDDQGHGTTVASLIAARFNNGVGIAGVCGNCQIIPVKAADAKGNATWSTLASALTWATDQGAKIVNISIAGPSGSPILAQAVGYAQSKGVLVVGAAGNDKGIGPEYPAAYPGVISVAASDENDNLYDFSNHGASVMLAAPGCVATISRGNSYVGACGTSYAAPLVAGIAGLLESYAPTASLAQVTTALLTTADQVGNVDSQYGRVNAWRALKALPAAPSATVAPTISGTVQEGQALQAATGNWAGSAPVAYGYQWQRSQAGGFVDIAGATRASYAVAATDVARQLRVKVIATNGIGTASAYSPATTLVTGLLTAPLNVTAPTVHVTSGGSVRAGAVLVASPGTWNGSPSYSYQWLACNKGACTPVRGETHSSFRVSPQYAGQSLEILVTARNAAGQATASSSPAPVVAAKVVKVAAVAKAKRHRR